MTLTFLYFTCIGVTEWVFYIISDFIAIINIFDFTYTNT